MNIRPAEETDLIMILGLLEENHLHTEDSAKWDLESFYVAIVNDQITGCLGMEVLGEVGLVRSVAVDSAYRGQGIARKLHTHAKSQARIKGIKKLYLLTISAGEYFEKLKYKAIDRDKLPSAIKETWEYSQACPEDAVVMCLDLQTLSEQALAQFEQGWYCAESVVQVIAKAKGMQTDILPGIASGMCSGIARTGGICGAVAGGILALSLIYGRKSPADSMSVLYSKIQDFQDLFIAKQGTTNCSSLLEGDLGTQEGQDHFKKEMLHLDCREYVGDAVDILEKLL